MNEIAYAFGKNLRLYREFKNMNQREFAEFLGIPQPKVSGYEDNKIKPTLDGAVSIAQKCGLSLDFLCGMPKNQSPESIKFKEALIHSLEDEIASCQKALDELKD